jgi:hypothetical protein
MIKNYMDELDMRLENNLLYGDPKRIIAIGTNRNLVQGAQPPEKSRRDERRDPIRDLESVLEFGYGDQLKKETNEKRRKRISQGSIPRHNHHDNVCKEKLSLLRRALEFTGLL